MRVVDSPMTDNIWASLADEISPSIAPEGFESTAEIQKKINNNVNTYTCIKIGKGYSQTKIFLRKALAEGRLDIFVSRRNGGKFYRPKDYAKNKGESGKKHRSHR